MIKRKWIIMAVVPFVLIFMLLLSLTVVSNDDDDDPSSADISLTDLNAKSLSPDVLKYKALMEKYCKEFGIPNQVSVLLAIMQCESGGKSSDVMQSSESVGQPAGTLSPEASIKQACKYFANLIKQMKSSGTDTNTVIQAYNYGPGFIDFVAKHGKKYTLELSTEFAKEHSGGKQVTYTNPIAPSGWRYAYGNMYYAQVVNQYLGGISIANFTDKTVKKIMTEALKYQGRPYVFGGSSPSTSFDCSGLTAWCYAKAGISLPRTAQAQYDVTAHLDIKDAKPGDLVFFKGTYNAGTYITHVGIYVGNMTMYNAGDPIGYANLNTAYWQAHIVGAGRIKK